MTAKELTEYLQQFPEGSMVSIIIANPDKGIRQVYPVREFNVLKQDKEITQPVFVIGVGAPMPLDGKGD